MKIKSEKIVNLITEIDSIISRIAQEEKRYQNQLSAVCTTYERSARNLIHYHILRSVDLRDIQKKLGNLGLSRLARSEQHVMASLLNTIFILGRLFNSNNTNGSDELKKPGLSIKKGEKLLTQHTKSLLGYRSKGRRVRIMVTLPSEAANDLNLVLALASSGMNCARINCAHDEPEMWKKMIDNVQLAGNKIKRKITICMDLAGPKIRTGIIAKGPPVTRYSPNRNAFGRVIDPAVIPLVDSESLSSVLNGVVVSSEWLRKLKIEEKIVFKDTRDKQRELIVTKRQDEHVVFTQSNSTCYIGKGVDLHASHNDESTTSVINLPSSRTWLLIKPGDIVTVHASSKPGESASYDTDGKITSKAHISCTYPSVFESVKTGENIFFDDGKISGKITEVSKEYFDVVIHNAKTKGTKLRADKGINLPDTDLKQGGLTAKDYTDLAFIAEHADVVNYSFVNSPEDVENLIAELDKLGVLGKLGIILKIETKKAYDNLIDMLLTGMKTKHVGVMIARGDLAIETGWENIGRIQKEILTICSAAHVPVVWATQVLENLAKTGIPSRAEITDTVNSLKAECVMLNKGPFINQAMQLLNKILRNMEDYQHKNVEFFPEMEKSM